MECYWREGGREERVRQLGSKRFGSLVIRRYVMCEREMVIFPTTHGKVMRWGTCVGIYKQSSFFEVGLSE